MNLNFLPQPLHPAVVHFPIALVAVGSLISLLSMIFKSEWLTKMVAVLLIFGALGGAGAWFSGERAERLVVPLQKNADRVLEEHSEWAERAAVLTGVSAVFALSAALTLRWPRLSTAFRIGTFLVVVAATVCLYQTAHYGGQLVYRHGVGVHNKGLIHSSKSD